MIRNFYLLSLFFLVLNCSTNPGTAFLGPVITGVKSGSIYQTSLSFGSNKAIEKVIFLKFCGMFFHVLAKLDLEIVCRFFDGL